MPDLYTISFDNVIAVWFALRFPGNPFYLFGWFYSLNIIQGVLIEPHYEKTGFLHMRKQRRRSASRSNHKSDQRLCFRYIDSIIPLLLNPNFQASNQ